MSIEIKVLGTGCANCRRLYAEAEKAVTQLSAPATLRKVEDIREIMTYKILATPALVINGEVKSAGRIPSARGDNNLAGDGGNEAVSPTPNCGAFEGGEMPEYLETTVDKFTFKVARDRLYTRDGVWVLPIESPEGVTVRIGLTDYVQQHSGDVAFANLKPIGTALNFGDEFAEIETIKVNVGLPSPVAGASCGSQ